MRCPYCRTSERFLVKLTKSAALTVDGDGHVKTQEHHDTSDVLCADCGQVLRRDDKKELLRAMHDVGDVVGEFEFLPRE